MRSLYMRQDVYKVGAQLPAGKTSKGGIPKMDLLRLLLLVGQWQHQE